MREIKIKCTGTKFVSLHDLKEFQEDIKKINPHNLNKLKESIKKSFILPFCIWNNNILDGHQRKKALIDLENEGWIIPELPVIEIEAKTIADAKKIVLSLTSQHGEFDLSKVQEYIINRLYYTYIIISLNRQRRFYVSYL